MLLGGHHGSGESGRLFSLLSLGQRRWWWGPHSSAFYCVKFLTILLNWFFQSNPVREISVAEEGAHTLLASEENVWYYLWKRVTSQSYPPDWPRINILGTSIFHGPYGIYPACPTGYTFPAWRTTSLCAGMHPHAGWEADFWAASFAPGLTVPAGWEAGWLGPCGVQIAPGSPLQESDLLWLQFPQRGLVWPPSFCICGLEMHCFQEFFAVIEIQMLS